MDGKKVGKNKRFVVSLAVSKRIVLNSKEIIIIIKKKKKHMHAKKTIKLT